MNDYGSNVSATNDNTDTGYDTIIFQQGRPPLDREWNQVQDISNEERKRLLQITKHSGLLDGVFNKISENALLDGFYVTTAYPNQFEIKNPTTNNILHANVNGNIIRINGSLTNGATNLNPTDSVATIKLNVPPAIGARDDLVFLEVWKKQIAPNPDIEGKPAADKIWKYGNTEFGGTNLDDDLYDVSIGVETTERVQVQYRFRVVNSIDFAANPNGLGNPNIEVQGGRDTPLVASSGYVYTNMFQVLGDSGLWRAGNGTADDRTNLQTIDGYSYAIPIARIHRRNTQAYSPTNLNGSATEITDLISDRPDGLFNDQVSIYDIEDLKHNVKELDTNGVLDNALDTFLKRRNQFIGTSTINNDVKGIMIPQTDGISGIDQPGISDIAKPNAQRRIFGDALETQITLTTKTTFDKTVGISGPWISGDAIEIQVATLNPVGTVISSSTPVVQAIISNTVTAVVGTWTGLGTINATFTLGINASLTTEDLIIHYDLDIGKGNGLSFIPDRALLLKDISGNKLGFVEYLENKKERFDIPSLRVTNTYTDRVFSNRIDDALNEIDCGTTEILYYVNGNGTSTYLIPRSIYGFGVSHVRDCTDLTLVTEPKININTWEIKDGSNFEVELGKAFNAGQTFLLKLECFGKGIDVERYTKSIKEFGICEQIELTFTGELSQQVYVDGPIYAIQSAITDTASGEEEKCYLNDEMVNCTYTYTRKTSSMIKVAFAAPATGTVKFTVRRAFTPQVGERYNLTYQYPPYSGSFLNYQNGVASFKIFTENPIDEKLTLKHIDNSGRMFMTSSGTAGFIKTATGSTNVYSGVIERIPFTSTGATVRTSDFNSTLIKPLGANRGTPFFSNLISSDQNTDSTSPVIGMMTGEPISFNDINSLANQIHFNGLFELDSNTNHVNFIAFLARIEKTREEYKVLPGEIVLVVISNTQLNNKSADIDFVNDSTNCLWDIFTIEGRPLFK